MSEHDTDDRMRALLEDAVSGVEPREGLSSIRSRTAARPRRSWLVAGSAVLATAAVVTAVAVLPGALRGSDPEAGPAAGPSLSPTTAAERTVNVYFVGPSGVGPRLYAEPVTFADPDATLTGALEDAIAGNALDGDLGSPWPDATVLQHAEGDEDAIVVDLGGPVAERPSATTEAEAAMALQQLVYTAQEAVGVQAPVTFLVDGRRTESVLGQPTSSRVTALTSDEALAPVSIESPGAGASVDGTFTVDGQAATFEANVQWELRQGDEVVRSGFATAQECCTLSPYSFEVEAPPGEYTLVVFEEDVSGGEGNPPSQDTREITVR